MAEVASGAGKRRLRGRVVSAKGEKTLVVAVERMYRHPKYKKFVRTTSTYHVHDESGAVAQDAVVVIEECRPLSRTKRWRVVDGAVAE